MKEFAARVPFSASFENYLHFVKFFPYCFSLQYTCNSKTRHTNSTTLQIQICSYKPYTKVECYVRALNNAVEPGDIGRPDTVIYTKCDCEYKLHPYHASCFV